MSFYGISKTCTSDECGDYSQFPGRGTVRVLHTLNRGVFVRVVSLFSMRTRILKQMRLEALGVGSMNPHTFHIILSATQAKVHTAYRPGLKIGMALRDPWRRPEFLHIR